MSVEKLIPRWLNLEGAVNYLNNEKTKAWTIADVLELGSLGKLKMYAVLDDGCFIYCWDTSSNSVAMREVEIKDFPRLTQQQVQKIQKMYPATGYLIEVDAPLPPRDDACI